MEKAFTTEIKNNKQLPTVFFNKILVLSLIILVVFKVGVLN